MAHTPDETTHHGADLAAHQFFHNGPPPTEHKHHKKGAAIPNIFANRRVGEDEDMNVVNDSLVHDVRTQSQAANDYDSGTVSIGRAVDAQEVAQLLPRDTQRTRALFFNGGASAVVIGKTGGGLQQGNGYTIPPNGSLEVYTQARIFGVVVPTAGVGTMCAISVWVERNR